MDDIVAEAGLSKGAVYWYFSSKDEIIKSILERFLSRELEDLRELLSYEGSLEQQLETMSDHLLEDLEQYENIMPIAYEFYALSTRESDIRKSLDRFFQDTIDVFQTLILRGIDRGELEPVDPHDTALAIVAYLEGITLLWVVGVLAIDIARLGELIRSSLHLLVRGLWEENR